MEGTSRNNTFGLGIDTRASVNPIVFNAELAAKTTEQYGVTVPVNPMLEFDFNRNPVTFKCRLYIIKALLFRSKDQSGKADPFIKILLNNDVIVDDVASKIHNTLEPIFGK
jgi:hypothetical protein